MPLLWVCISYTGYEFIIRFCLDKQKMGCNLVFNRVENGQKPLSVRNSRENTKVRIYKNYE